MTVKMRVSVNMKVRVNMMKHICIIRCQISKFNYFNRCEKCNPVKNIQKILLDKCGILHSFKNQIVDYYGCDKCCKLRNLFDDYILPFTELNKYQEYDEVHEIMRDDVQKKIIHLSYILK